MASITERMVLLIETATKGNDKILKMQKDLERINAGVKTFTKVIDESNGRVVKQENLIKRLNAVQDKYKHSVNDIRDGNENVLRVLKDIGVSYNKKREFIDKVTKEEIQAMDVKKRFTELMKKNKITQQDVNNKTQKYRKRIREAGLQEQKYKDIVDETTGKLLNKQQIVKRATNFIANEEAKARQKQQEYIEGVKRQYKGMSDVFAASNENFKAHHQILGQHNSRLVRFASTVRMATLGIKGFRAEVLSLLFFGMALQRWMMSIASPAAETVGIFELWSTTLELLLLPVMEDLLPFFVKLLEFVADMPEPLKKIIGYFIIFTGVLGWGFKNVAMWSLGIGALIGNFRDLKPLVTNWTWKGFLVGLAPFVKIAAAILVLYGLYKLLISSNEELIEKSETYKNIVNDTSDAWGLLFSSTKKGKEEIDDASDSMSFFTREQYRGRFVMLEFQKTLIRLGAFFKAVFKGFIPLSKYVWNRAQYYMASFFEWGFDKLESFARMIDIITDAAPFMRGTNLASMVSPISSALGTVKSDLDKELEPIGEEFKLIAEEFNKTIEKAQPVAVNESMENLLRDYNRTPGALEFLQTSNAEFFNSIGKPMEQTQISLDNLNKTTKDLIKVEEDILSGINFDDFEIDLNSFVKEIEKQVEDMAGEVNIEINYDIDGVSSTSDLNAILEKNNRELERRLMNDIKRLT